MPDLDWLVETRLLRPEAIAEAAAARERPAWPPPKLLVIAADHTARGIVEAGGRAMTDRGDLLDRLVLALSRPGVNGVLGTPDIIEDLLLLGALDAKVVFGSMNRGGIQGADVDDRRPLHRLRRRSIDAFDFEGGKLLLRIDPTDERTPRTLEAAAHAVSELAARRRIAMVEPFWADSTPEGAMRAISIASALGNTSAYTWLKVPIVRRHGAGDGRDHAAVADPRRRRTGRVRPWAHALTLPPVRGLVVGRSLLYPHDDDVAAAVDTAASLLG